MAFAQAEGGRQGVDHGLRHMGGLLRMTQVFQHQQELVAAQAPQGVLLAHTLAQSLGHHLEQQVARGVSQAVVDGLEVVQVDEDHAHQRLMSARQVHGMVQPLMDHGAVGQLGQGVVVGHARQARLGLLELGDVGQHADKVRGVALVVAHGADRQLGREQLATLALAPGFALPGSLFADFLTHLVDEVH
ncbi:MAG TPA: hypothetical protein PKV17_07975, partial [Aquabacterium sp.]|nr:hypothetical protein [Aquabacterium sp.]